MQAYWSESLNIRDLEILGDLAVASGLDTGVVGVVVPVFVRLLQ